MVASNRSIPRSAKNRRSDAKDEASNERIKEDSMNCNAKIIASLLSLAVIFAWVLATSATGTTRASGLNDDPVDAQCDTPPTYSYYYQPKALQGTSCTFTITGASPCFVPFPSLNDPSTRPADSAIADFTNDRGDTAK